jgi:hypothetical protein
MRLHTAETAAAGNYALACFRQSLKQKPARYAGEIKLLRKTSPSGKMVSVQAAKKPMRG